MADTTAPGVMADSGEPARRVSQADPGWEFVAQLLEHHGVAAFTWWDGRVTWANDVALGLIAEEPDREDPDFLTDRLSRSFNPPAELLDLAPGEQRVVEIELSATRALLTMSAIVARTERDDGDSVLVTFRAPLEAMVDPGTCQGVVAGFFRCSFERLAG